MKTFALCFTGLSGSGKTTLLRELDRIIQERGVPVQAMDGDQLRKELGQLFGFSREERMKQGCVVRLLSRYLNQNGISTIIAGVEAYEEGRLLMRRDFGECYVQVYLDCPIEECIRRDVKGYYKDLSKLKDFNGIDAPYEIPTDSEIVVDTVHLTVDESVQKIIDYLEGHGYLEKQMESSMETSSS